MGRETHGGKGQTGKDKQRYMVHRGRDAYPVVDPNESRAKIYWIGKSSMMTLSACVLAARPKVS